MVVFWSVLLTYLVVSLLTGRREPYLYWVIWKGMVRIVDDLVYVLVISLPKELHGVLTYL